MYFKNTVVLFHFDILQKWSYMYLIARKTLEPQNYDFKMGHSTVYTSIELVEAKCKVICMVSCEMYIM